MGCKDHTIESADIFSPALMIAGPG